MSTQSLNQARSPVIPSAIRPVAGQVIRGMGETRRPPGPAPVIPSGIQSPQVPAPIIPDILRATSSSGDRQIKEVSIPQFQRRMDSASSVNSNNSSVLNSLSGPRRPPPPRVPAIATQSPITTSNRKVNYAPPPVNAIPRPRPVPPPIRPPGIPIDQPPPPTVKSEHVKPSRSIRPPPKIMESKSSIQIIAPTTEPPTIKGKKEKAVVVEQVNRRDRLDPEFEDSDDEIDKEADKKDFLERAVKQPNIPISDIKKIEKIAENAQDIPKLFNDDKNDDNEMPEKLKDEIGLGRQESVELSIVNSEIQSIVPMKSFTAKSIKEDNEEDDNQEGDNSESDDDDDDENQPVNKIDNSLFTQRLTIMAQKENEQRKLALEKANVNYDSVANLIPPPPTEDNLMYQQSRLAEILPRGRFSIRCLEGFNVRRREDIQNFFKNDVFIKFKLGISAGLPYKPTQVYKKQNDNPKFNDEIIYFDVIDPNLYIMNDDLQLIIEVYHKGPKVDECMGVVNMSVVRFFRQPFTIYEERVPLKYPNSYDNTNSKLRLEFIFEEARSGMFVITLYEARDLRIVDPINRQDPYVEIQLSKNYIKQSKVIKNGKSNPYFNNEEIILWVDQNNWINDLYMYVLDNEYGHDKPIGFTHFCLLPYMNSRPEDAQQDIFDLFYYEKINRYDETQSEEIPKGELVFKITYLPAGKLTILIDKAKGLQFPPDYKPSSNTDVTRLDAYASLSIEGKAVNMLKRTPVDKDGGNDPIWHSEVEFDIVDQYIAVLEVYHQGINGADILLGYCEFSLLQVFRNGHIDFWIALKQNKAKGGFIEIGNVYIDCKFSGLSGIAYPQYRPDVDSFDDTVRKILPDKSKETILEDDDQDQVINARKPIDTIPTEEDYANMKKPSEKSELPTEKPDIETEFTEDEIKAAFNFIDLNHNNFIGASEIRHILICMGELITDEEIDMMISMVDLDGDGQVSYKEFYTLVVTPNPEKVDLHKQIQKSIDDELLQEKLAVEVEQQD
eukprot:CAMPEP_0196763708 /NCGR_PEP_ID=MMETSP1095-20130614/4580_1 /TAXON_ID=96789 ORGANISM="Chromulina nebulosa, Strain UTEXLB2642" /NCGR_SAMPLE_ID=MMETSP1095 /ASSEMBLY_ACC=CAM_ASM_000446 /LENGTH=1006 /DNA_ID=CAMNT_0042117473 /DNA_START=155 /DNA_END=3176 /DNA_ORIENTATION=-